MAPKMFRSLGERHALFLKGFGDTPGFLLALFFAFSGSSSHRRWAIQ